MVLVTLFPPALAVITVVPAALPVTLPLESTVATLLFDEVQLMPFVIYTFSPAYLAETLNVIVSSPYIEFAPETLSPLVSFDGTSII